ncbi:hypothetical protein G3T14_22020 [Methylobacterium sp. BTF04]|uniref:hypothetical protein n=1 Tax=Methylobacterium sp. BTF04 TaxID=2708300 RepID=UPI0013D80E92|nr:hypothetical protein [Methylobacterium sp. BTF04]NEU14758.1 hypothetical protein [Methylobacterium sp. BTF04]
MPDTADVGSAAKTEASDFENTARYEFSLAAPDLNPTLSLTLACLLFRSRFARDFYCLLPRSATIPDLLLSGAWTFAGNVHVPLARVRQIQASYAVPSYERDELLWFHNRQPMHFLVKKSRSTRRRNVDAARTEPVRSGERTVKAAKVVALAAFATQV